MKVYTVLFVLCPAVFGWNVYRQQDDDDWSHRGSIGPFGFHLSSRGPPSPWQFFNRHATVQHPFRRPPFVRQNFYGINIPNGFPGSNSFASKFRELAQAGQPFDNMMSVNIDLHNALLNKLLLDNPLFQEERVPGSQPQDFDFDEVSEIHQKFLENAQRTRSNFASFIQHLANVLVSKNGVLASISKLFDRNNLFALPRSDLGNVEGPLTVDSTEDGLEKILKAVEEVEGSVNQKIYNADDMKAVIDEELTTASDADIDRETNLLAKDALADQDSEIGVVVQDAGPTLADIQETEDISEDIHVQTERPENELILTVPYSEDDNLIILESEELVSKNQAAPSVDEVQLSIYDTDDYADKNVKVDNENDEEHISDEDFAEEMIDDIFYNDDENISDETEQESNFEYDTSKPGMKLDLKIDAEPNSEEPLFPTKPLDFPSSNALNDISELDASEKGEDKITTTATETVPNGLDLLLDGMKTVENELDGNEKLLQQV